MSVTHSEKKKRSVPLHLSVSVDRSMHFLKKAETNSSGAVFTVFLCTLILSFLQGAFLCLTRFSTWIRCLRSRTRRVERGNKTQGSKKGMGRLE
jgi:hypothetical protein